MAARGLSGSARRGLAVADDVEPAGLDRVLLDQVTANRAGPAARKIAVIGRASHGIRMPGDEEALSRKTGSSMAAARASMVRKLLRSMRSLSKAKKFCRSMARAPSTTIFAGRAVLGFGLDIAPLGRRLFLGRLPFDGRRREGGELAQDARRLLVCFGESGGRQQQCR